MILCSQTSLIAWAHIWKKDHPIAGRTTQDKVAFNHSWWWFCIQGYSNVLQGHINEHKIYSAAGERGNCEKHVSIWRKYGTQRWEHVLVQFHPTLCTYANWETTNRRFLTTIHAHLVSFYSCICLSTFWSSQVYIQTSQRNMKFAKPSIRDRMMTLMLLLLDREDNTYSSQLQPKL